MSPESLHLIGANDEGVKVCSSRKPAGDRGHEPSLLLSEKAECEKDVLDCDSERDPQRARGRGRVVGG